MYFDQEGEQLDSDARYVPLMYEYAAAAAAAAASVLSTTMRCCSPPQALARR